MLVGGATAAGDAFLHGDLCRRDGDGEAFFSSRDAERFFPFVRRICRKKITSHQISLSLHFRISIIWSKSQENFKMRDNLNNYTRLHRHMPQLLKHVQKTPLSRPYYP